MKPFKIQISVIIYLYDNHYIFSEPKMARGQIRKMYVKLGSFPATFEETRFSLVFGLARKETNE